MSVSQSGNLDRFSVDAGGSGVLDVGTGIASAVRIGKSTGAGSNGSPTLFGVTAQAPMTAVGINYTPEGSGSNNAITATLNDVNGNAVPIVVGMLVYVQLTSHTLQAGANTFALNSQTAKAIKSHLNPANNIAAGYNSGVVPLLWDGVEWLDMSQ